MNCDLAFLSGSPGWGELLLVFAVVLVLFGPRRLPELARMIGKALEELRRASQDFRNEVMRIDSDVKETVRDAVYSDSPDEEDAWDVIDVDSESDSHAESQDGCGDDEAMYGESAGGPEHPDTPSSSVDEHEGPTERKDDLAG